MDNRFTDDNIRLSTQNLQKRYIKIDLLDYNFHILGSVEGDCTNGSININADSDIRRTANITFVISNKNKFELGFDKNIWINKYLKIWVGIENNHTQKKVWTNCGIYIIDAPNYNYDSVNDTLTLSLLDLMSKLTGVRNGYLKGIPFIFKSGENIRNAIIDILNLLDFHNYIIQDIPEPGVFPFDLEFGQGSTAYELLKGILNLYPGYEMFFDVDGTFIYQKIPTGKDESVSFGEKFWNNIIISENTTVDFQNVKNSIEVYGRIHDPAFFSAETTLNGSSIALNIPEMTEYSVDTIYGFTLTNPPHFEGGTIRVNSLQAYPIYLDDGATAPVIEAEEGEVYYCAQFKGSYWNWLGHLQAYASIEDTNPESPFFVNGPVGRIRLPLFSGEYDNIVTDDLARQRAEYELYLHSQLNDSVTLTCVPVYWLDVNLLTQYVTRQNNKLNYYIIKAINLGLSPSDTMSITLVKFYPSQYIEPAVCDLIWNSEDSCLVWNDDDSDVYWN